MKNLAFALALGLATSTAIMAVPETSTVEQGPAKKEVKIDDVPVAVKEAFAKDNGMAEVMYIYKIENDKSTQYEFILHDDDRQWSVTYDKAGNKLDKERA